MTDNSDSQTHAPMDGEDETAGDALAQFVTFFLGKECFAFPMSAVLEIIRSPFTVPVPLTSPGLVGLANLRGDILPVVDLRTTLGLEPRAFDDVTRAVVVDCGRPIALMVDRVSSVLDADPEAIESAEGTRTISELELLTGVLKDVAGHDLVQIIDVDRTVQHEFAGMTADASARIDMAAAAVRAVENPAEVDDAEDDAAQYVSLVVDDQEYAFEIDQVDEIVRVPATVTSVPRAASHVQGLIKLRDRLLPLVSLRRMFGLPDEEPTEQHRIVVVRMPGSDRDRVGVVVDHVQEVLRVQDDERADMPGLLKDSGAEEIDKICMLDDGKRLVGVLSLDRLFHHPAMQEAMDVGHEQNVEHGADAAQEIGEIAMNEDEDADECQLVVYRLDGEEYGVQINFVKEIIRVPETLTEVPRTAAYVEGMINLRGAVLPVASMRKRFDLDVVERNDGQRILVLNVDERQTGFVVDSVTEVLRLPRTALEPAPDLSDEQRRLIGRVAKLDDGQRIVQILDAEELMAGQPDITEDAA